MGNIEKGSIKHLVILIITIAIVLMIIEPLGDLFIAKVLTHSEFAYSFSDYIVEPVILSFILGITLWLIDKRSVKNDKE